MILLNAIRRDGYYLRETDPGSIGFIALAIEITLLTGLLWLTASALDRTTAGRRVRQWAFLALLIVPGTIAIRHYSRSVINLALMNRWLMGATVVCTLALFMGLYRFRQQVVRIAITLLIILSPLGVVNFASAAWLRMKYRDERAAMPITTRSDTPRIIWIIFDELDQNTVFVNATSSVSLPEFDRFRAQSLVVQNAYPPSGATLSSLPALITGQIVADAQPLAANELGLTLSNGAKVKWSEQSTVFSQARAEGFSSGVAGWYHPYCRILGRSLDLCLWGDLSELATMNDRVSQLTLRQAMLKWTREVLNHMPIFRLRGESQPTTPNTSELEAKQTHITEFQSVSTKATSLIAKDLNLILLHFPVPHSPWIYDVSRHTFSADPGHGGYLNNVELADRALGEIRNRLEESNRWDSSIVLISSDHWWRESPLVNGRRDHRIPFMLKLASQKSSLEYQVPVNSIVTRELLMQLLRGNLRNSEDVAMWLDHNSMIAESPVTKDLP